MRVFHLFFEHSLTLLIQIFTMLNSADLFQEEELLVRIRTQVLLKSLRSHWPRCYFQLHFIKFMKDLLVPVDLLRIQSDPSIWTFRCHPSGEGSLHGNGRQLHRLGQQYQSPPNSSLHFANWWVVQHVLPMLAPMQDNSACPMLLWLLIFARQQHVSGVTLHDVHSFCTSIS